MYSYIKGELVEIAEDLIVVEANNIGYKYPCAGTGIILSAGAWK